MVFHNREEAGRQLAELLRKYKGENAIVLALPRGGLPVGWVIARAIEAPLDVILVRKLGAPMQPELAVGALAEGGEVIVDRHMLSALQIPGAVIDAIVRRETAELERRRAIFRGDRPFPDLEGKTVILVDDGLATGATARAAIHAVRRKHPARIVLAVPVAALESLRAIEPEVDEVVCIEAASEFYAVGLWYREFEQLSDDDVRRLLDDETVAIPAGAVTLSGEFIVPPGAPGVVLFAHGSGSSRRSPRNRKVADVLRQARLGTLLVDLLTPTEETNDEQKGEFRFDIPFLAGRLTACMDWLGGDPRTRALPVGLFGASTGAAAALVAAANRPDGVFAIVSRGGRPDLAMAALPRVRAPTLLIVGARDTRVLAWNRQALATLRGEAALVVVPAATHLFEEPGALDEVARLATDWFRQHVAPQAARGAA